MRFNIHRSRLCSVLIVRCVSFRFGASSINWQTVQEKSPSWDRRRVQRHRMTWTNNSRACLVPLSDFEEEQSELWVCTCTKLVSCSFHVILEGIKSPWSLESSPHYMGLVACPKLMSWFAPNDVLVAYYLVLSQFAKWDAKMDGTPCSNPGAIV